MGDPELTILGQRTRQLLATLESEAGGAPIGSRPRHVRCVLDHVLNGEADVGIVFGPDAVQESQRIRVGAVSERGIIPPVIHSMAMERYCPNWHSARGSEPSFNLMKPREELSDWGTSPSQSQPTRKE